MNRRQRKLHRRIVFKSCYVPYLNARSDTIKCHLTGVDEFHAAQVARRAGQRFAARYYLDWSRSFRKSAGKFLP